MHGATRVRIGCPSAPAKRNVEVDLSIEYVDSSGRSCEATLIRTKTVTSLERTHNIRSIESMQFGLALSPNLKRVRKSPGERRLRLRNKNGSFKLEQRRTYYR